MNSTSWRDVKTAMGGGTGWGLEYYDCVINNDCERLEALVEQHNIDLNAKFTEVRKKNHLDLSPIHLVAYKGYTGMLQYLYDVKCDIHQTTATHRRTAFHFAVLRHKVACFHKLLSLGTNPDPRDTFGNSPCHYAAEDGNVDMLDVLLKQSIDVNAQDITLKTPLMKATRNGKIEAVKRLVAKGCCLNVRDKNRDTALHFAARHGRAQLLQVIIGGGADVNIQNQWGHTPLMAAVSYNNKDATAILLAAGCDVNHREYKRGENALHTSVRKKYLVITEQLLATGQVKYCYNYQGELGIYDAILNQKLDTVKLFLKYNYDFDRAIKLEYDGTGGKTVIRICLEKGHFEILRMLAYVGHVISYNTTPIIQRPTGPAGLFIPEVQVTGPGGAGQQGQGQSEAELIAGIQRFLQDINIVRSLKQMCRKGIRKHMGFGIHDKIDQLPIPTPLKSFLLLDDIRL